VNQVASQHNDKQTRGEPFPAIVNHNFVH